MAVEKLYMVNIVGLLRDEEDIILDVLSGENMNLVSALHQFSTNREIYSLDKDNLDKVLDLNEIDVFTPDLAIRNQARDAKEILENLGMELPKNPTNPHELIKTDFTKHDEVLKAWLEEEKELQEKVDENHKFSSKFSRFHGLSIPLEDIQNMEYFQTRFGLLNKDGRIRMKSNYGNMLAYIFHTGTEGEDEVYMIVYPNEVAAEIDRILKSLNWMDIDMPKEEGTPAEVMDTLEKERKETLGKIQEIQEKREEYVRQNRKELEKALEGILLRNRIDEAKENMAHSKNYLCISGWMNGKDADALEKTLSKYDEITFQKEDMEEKSKTPPTKLNNPSFFRPFESLVKMYGVPNYKEKDPTVFLGITYLILFGSMFGDVGQGFIFFLFGLLLMKKGKESFGGLLSRMGVSSMIFGFLYGSLFGKEDILPALWIKPFHNINQILEISIAFGVVLLTFAYIFGIRNALLRGDKEEAFLGKEGVVGLTVFLLFVIMATSAVTGHSILPTPVVIGLMVVALGLSIFKRPIFCKLEGKAVKYPGQDKAGYYIEGSFSLLEMLISILSGIVSFIRVGAFAINHVGLFLAFQTMADMMPSKGAGILILILGNILIIGLEGLIVFIQGLRLEYYELFSRYYRGDGYEFKASGLK